LQDGLAKIKGMLFEGNSFELKTDDLIKFEKNFPCKEKLVTETQLKH
jgi:hypothetical protein